LNFIVALGSIAIGVLAIEGIVRFIVDDGRQYDLEMWKYARDVKRISNDPLLGHAEPASQTHGGKFSDQLQGTARP
jgi:hypothetical protein